MLSYKYLFLNIFTWVFVPLSFSQGPIKKNTGYALGFKAISSAAPLAYCMPPMSACDSPNYYEMDSVSFGSIHNASSCGTNGYTDYTATTPVASVSAGTFVPVTIKFNIHNTYADKYVSVGADFNQNGEFDPGEFQKLGFGKTTVSAFVRIPFTALTGITRLRFRVSAYETITMCSSIGSGETEDYSISVSAATSAGPHFAFYVNSIATGSGNGFSWPNAFTNLAPALSVALPYDTIRVAKGIYIPGNTNNSYFTMKDSVIILGGFPNSGNPGDVLRNWSLNQTILSGEFGAAGNPLDNTQSLIYGADGFILDGFILEGVLTSSIDGGGAVALYSCVLPKFRHCVFRNNYTTYGNSSITSLNSSAIFSDCIFTANSDAFDYSMISSTVNSNLSFINCIFYKNQGGKSLLASDSSIVTFFNCDFVSNLYSGATLTGANNSSFSINNSIFYHNLHTTTNSSSWFSTDSSEIQLSASMLTITNTITQNYQYGNTELLSINPKFKDTSTITGPDNLYFSSDDGLQLINPCSPALNSGSNAAVSSITTDILGNARVFSSIVDLGAYEVQQAQLNYPATLYVNKAAIGTGNGSSWSNAFTDLQQAVQYCSDTIRVALGTYYPSATDEIKSFWLQNHRVILGGYPNTGNPTDAQRDPILNPTILSGEIPGSTEKSDVIITGARIDSTAVTDGFIISGSESLYAINNGAIRINKKSNPVFRNCIVRNNNNNEAGSALVTIDSASPKFINCIFENNIATVYSGVGAVTNELHSNPIFVKCIFRNNSTWLDSEEGYNGGAVANSESDPIFDSCTFANNVANFKGGAFSNYYSNPVIRNCSFTGNKTLFIGAYGSYGNDFYNYHSSPQVYNTKFNDSTNSDYGGCMYNINYSNPFFRKCEFYNGLATYDGGICFNDHSSPQFESCLFAGGVCTSGKGAAIYNKDSSNSTLINCLGIGNRAPGGFGSFMYNTGSFPVLKNCTITTNLFSPGNPISPAGIFVSTNLSQLNISNSIIWGDYPSVTANPLYEIVDGVNGPQTQINYSLTRFYGNAGMNGNIVGLNPLFVNVQSPAGADGQFFTNDDGYRLVSCSPALNSGLNSAIQGYSTDLIGNARIYNSTVDMGAYEYQSMPSQTTNTFTGAVNNVWENSLNWSLGVIPNACTNVIIPSPSSVLLSSNATIYSMTVTAGANVIVASGFTLTIIH